MISAPAAKPGVLQQPGVAQGQGAAGLPPGANPYLAGAPGAAAPPGALAAAGYPESPGGPENSEEDENGPPGTHLHSEHPTNAPGSTPGSPSGGPSAQPTATQPSGAASPSAPSAAGADTGQSPSVSDATKEKESVSGALKDFSTGNKKGYKILGDILAKAMIKAERKLEHGMQGAVIEKGRGERIVKQHAGKYDEKTDREDEERSDRNEEYGDDDQEGNGTDMASHKSASRARKHRGRVDENEASDHGSGFQENEGQSLAENEDEHREEASLRRRVKGGQRSRTGHKQFYAARKPGPRMTEHSAQHSDSESGGRPSRMKSTRVKHGSKMRSRSSFRAGDTNNENTLAKETAGDAEHEELYEDVRERSKTKEEKEHGGLENLFRSSKARKRKQKKLLDSFKHTNFSFKKSERY